MDRCIFFDSAAQTILLQKPRESDVLYVDHANWFVKIDTKEFNKLKAAQTTATIVSPFSYLFHEYRKKAEPALFGVVLEEQCYFAIFLDEKPLFWQICDTAQDITNGIERFLKDFYEKPQSFFIEKIYLYNCNEALQIDKEDIQERLLLPVEVYEEDEDRLCQEVALMAIDQQAEEPSFLKKYRSLLLIAAATLLVVSGYEIYLRYAIAQYEQKIANLVQKQVDVANKNNDYQAQLMHFQKLKPIVEAIKQNNALIASKIRTIFNLIPNDAYLTKAEIGKNALLFEGVCKSKKSLLRAFHEKMAKSFQKKRIRFTKMADGYRFQAVYEEMIDEKS